MRPKFNIGDYATTRSELVVVRSINSFHQYEVDEVDGGMRSRWLKDLDPIPLTKELLLKFGLKEAIKSSANTHFTLKVSHKKAKGLSQSFRFENGVLSASIGVFFVEFQYVHQFQNWVYAMTGKEIELKN